MLELGTTFHLTAIIIILPENIAIVLLLEYSGYVFKKQRNAVEPVNPDPENSQHLITYIELPAVNGPKSFQISMYVCTIVTWKRRHLYYP